MDKKTQEMLIELDLLRSLDWAPGTTVSGQDVHGTIAFLKGITRSLRLGTVFSERERKEKIETRLQSRRAVRRFRETIGRLLDAVDEMNDLLRAVADGILNSIGYRRHDRGEWRLKCDSTLFLQFRNTVEAMKSP